MSYALEPARRIDALDCDECDNTPAKHRSAPALFALACLLGAASVSAPSFAAQSYPARPVRLIVPFAPGGGTDITARAIALKLTERFGQQVVVDNRPGANGTIGMDITAKAAPDGHTLSTISSSHTLNVSLLKTVPYDLVRDLAPVTQATRQPYALVINPAVPAKSVEELIAHARARPGALNFGSSGTGGLSHLAGALFSNLARIDIVHVPYKGGSPALMDVLAGQIHMLFSTLLQANPHLKSGRLRALAVTTTQRSPAAPQLPTMQEAGVAGYEVTQWYGIVAPSKVPSAVIAKLSKEIARIVHEPDVKDRLAADGSEAVGSTPDDFGAHIRAEIAKWKKVVKETGIRAD
jgi:tripartite-type tricarboxylate transporter receptor subunit TctC